MLDIAVNFKVQTSDSKLSKYWIKIIQSNKLTFQKRSATHKTAELVAFTTVTLTRRVRRGAGNKLSQQKQKVITQVFFLVEISEVINDLFQGIFIKKSKGVLSPMN